MQKLLYLAQMIHMGRNEGERLVDASFEAWDYGPVEPELYGKVRMFGSKPISNVFFEARRFKEDDERRIFLEEICRDLLPKRAGELVEITHWEGGAWAKHYVPGARGVTIPDRDIAREYGDRIRDGHLKDN
ncbi:Panacea domain-containing protein [Methylobacterium sp. D53M]